MLEIVKSDPSRLKYGLIFAHFTLYFLPCKASSIPSSSFTVRSTRDNFWHRKPEEDNLIKSLMHSNMCSTVESWWKHPPSLLPTTVPKTCVKGLKSISEKKKSLLPLASVNWFSQAEPLCRSGKCPYMGAIKPRIAWLLAGDAATLWLRFEHHHPQVGRETNHQLWAADQHVLSRTSSL